jgi:GWxTD domain-containing protein
MTSTFRKHLFASALLCLPVLAQQPFRQQEGAPREQDIFFEAVPIFGEDTSKALVAFHYRIGKDFFVFVKNQSNNPAEQFIARGEIIIELLTSEGVSVGRQIQTVDLKRETMQAPPGQQTDIQGAVIFAVPDGTFNIVFEVDDKESGRSFVERRQTVTTRRPILKTLELSIPFFARIESNGASQTKYVVLNRGSDVMMGTRGGYLIQALFPDDGQPLRVNWKLEGRWDARQEKQEFKGSEYALVPGILRLLSSDKKISYEPQSSQFPWKILFIPLPLEKLETGAYQIDLEFAIGENKVDMTRNFRISWPNKPASLSNFELAVDALRLIAKEEEIEEMYGFTSVRGYQKFKEFWRKRDPDTSTVYNEVMAEFYRRVDEAVKRYSTPKENDGYKTDRGRIFIIYGSPTRTERRFLPNSAPMEIWTYENLRKRYIFSDQTRSGNFVLTEVENL